MEKAAPHPGKDSFHCVLTGLFGLLLCIGAIGYGRQEWTGAQRTEAARDWRATPCRILTSQPLHAGEEGYGLAITYEYQFAGGDAGGAEAEARTYTSDRVALNAHLRYRDYVEMQRQLAKFPAGATATCYVDPEHPAEAILLLPEQNAARHKLILGIVYALPGLLIGVGLLVLAFWSARKKGRLDERPSP